MKSLIKIFAVLIVLNVSTVLSSQKASAQEVSFQVFYDQLSPYGSWVNYPSYGYAWVPSVGPGFSPYETAGHWVYTDFGWTWVSDYPWGWAPFHYGRWYFDPVYGWIWIPDTEWGPAWVVWRSSPGYFGWAPLRPGVSISVAFGPGYYVPNDWWVFVPGQYMTSPVINQYYVPRSNNVTIINNTTIINKTYVDNGRHATYIAGPDRDQVQKVTGTPVKPVAIQDNDRPGQSFSNGQLKLYRPQVQKTSTNGQKPVPPKVVDMKDIKPQKREAPEQRTAPQQPANKQPVPAQKVSPAPNNKVKEQPASPQKVSPPDNKVKEQPAPPHQAEPVKQAPKTVAPNNNREQSPPPQNANPPHNDVQKEQHPAQPHSATPPHYNKAAASPPQSKEVQEKKQPQPEQREEHPKNNQAGKDSLPRFSK